jgi:DNA-binding MarR family transcriptional regulator
VSSTSTSHDEYNDRILQAIAADACISQRSLARELGIALGLTNSLVRGLVTRGLIRVSKASPQRLSYLLTPSGVAEKARMSRLALSRSVERYSFARRTLRDAFVQISASVPWAGDDKPIVFVGTGEVAEIGFICLQETDLRLVGAVDDQGRHRFFNVPLYPFDALTPDLLQTTGAQRLVVMSLHERERIRGRVRQARLPEESVVWL